MRNGKLVQTLTVAMCIGMFLVLLMGATVTQTESGRGCGDDWPLCNGQLIPAYTLESMIEYSHRIVSAVVGLLVLAATIAVLLFVRRRDAKVYAAGALFFTVLQAGLGAAQVRNPQSDAILALHFGFSLLAFTLTLLVVTAVRAEIRSRRSYGYSMAADPAPVSGKFRAAVWLTTLYTYIVVYTGAYTSHTESGGGCAGFPLCNGQLVPSPLQGPTSVAYMHRMAAFALFVIIVLLTVHVYRKYRDHREVFNGARWALALVAAQVLSGALMMLWAGTDNYLFGTLMHTLIIALLFAVLSSLSIAVWARGKGGIR